jgi:DNA-binding response OmpR family regulator/AraC-like DNA-binding protein
MDLALSVRPVILVVDDDAGLRDSLHLILDDKYEVVDAVDGYEALATLGVRRIDLILLDLVMSPADGFEVLQRISKTQKTVPIVVLSGLNTAWTAATAMRLGAMDYVTKPFDEEVLLAAVQEALASSSKPKYVPRGGQQPRIALVGVNVGIHASLKILLRPRCNVEQIASVYEVLGCANSLPPTVLVVNWNTLGAHAVEIVRWLRQRSPDTHVIVVSSARPPELGPYVLPTAPARVSPLLKEIQARVEPAVAAPPIHSPRVCTALDYLGDHYEVASVRRLGRAVGAAPHYVSAVFRREVGMSPRAYINLLRVEAAKWLLLGTSEKLETVAAHVGLHDASHLSRLFLKHAGNRPGAYRRQQSLDRNGVP